MYLKSSFFAIDYLEGAKNMALATDLLQSVVLVET